MRDRWKSKRLDYRKSWRSCCGFSLERHFKHLYPESDIRWIIRFRNFGYWQWWYNREKEWIAKKIGTHALSQGRGMGSISSWFRRSRNKVQRAKQKQALREAMRDDKLDELIIPTRRRDIRWDWW